MKFKTIKELEAEYDEETDIIRRIALSIKIHQLKDVLELIDEDLRICKGCKEKLKARITG